MVIVAKKQAVLPKGTHNGLIVSARETEVDFGNPGMGKEPTVELEIAPKWNDKDGTPAMNVTVNFSPSLNGLSALSKLLKNLGIEIVEGETFDPLELAGREITFESDLNPKGFVRVKKDSIRQK